MKPVSRGQGGPAPTVFAIFLTLGANGIHAATDPVSCAAIGDDAARLACYDRAFGRAAVAAESATDVVGKAEEGDDPSTKIARRNDPKRERYSDGKSRLWRLWEHDSSAREARYSLRPHRGIFFMPLRYSDRRNRLPDSPAPGHTATEPLSIEATETMFQVSIKTRIWENLFGDHPWDLWFGFTQVSHWQMYNGEVSSPFRETNYEPELIFSLPLKEEIAGLDWRVLNIGLVHQSNGRSNPLSRSWNRVYAEFGFERGPWTALVRPWYRLPEARSGDDNPDIDDFLGYGDLNVSWTRGGHILGMMSRHNLIGGRGALQLDWSFPLTDTLKGYLRLFSGYGETMVDYNHYQNVIGIGLQITPWQD